MTGTIRDITPVLAERGLKIRTEIELDSGRFIELPLPRRELAALLPRSLLTGQSGTLPAEFPRIAKAVLKTFLIGRRVTVRRRKRKLYFTFLLWDLPLGPKPRTMNT